MMCVDWLYSECVVELVSERWWQEVTLSASWAEEKVSREAVSLTVNVQCSLHCDTSILEAPSFPGTGSLMWPSHPNTVQSVRSKQHSHTGRVPPPPPAVVALNNLAECSCQRPALLWSQVLNLAKFHMMMMKMIHGKWAHKTNKMEPLLFKERAVVLLPKPN